MSEIWVVRAGRGARYADDFERMSIVAIGNENLTTDLSSLDRDALIALARNATPGESKAALMTAVGQLYRFAHEVSEGDWIITPDSGTRELLYGRATGNYVFQSSPMITGFHHTRPVQWEGRKSRDLLPQRVLYSLGSVLTVFKPKGREHLLAFLEDRDISGVPDVLEEADEAADTDLFADLEARSDELIQQKIAFLDGYETQALFAGMLRAMGYHTQVASEGADGGVDIIASRDPLGVEPPIIKVQVKARPSTKSNAADARQLSGVLREGERGVFVSTGGFTRDALIEATTGKVQFVDIDRLQELLVEYYSQLDQDTKSLVPLRRLYFP